MPPAIKKTVSTAVSAKYIPYRIFAVRLAFGTSLSASGPGTSARISGMALSSSREVIIITKTSTPIPPIQCVKLLQNAIPFGRISISVKIVDPVVVNPDTVSKNASI
jgi:hypothetical protein